MYFCAYLLIAEIFKIKSISFLKGKLDALEREKEIIEQAVKGERA